MKEKAEYRRQQKAFEEAQATHADWQAQVAMVTDYIEIAREFRGLPPSEVDSPLVPKKDETVYAIVESAGLVEPRRLPGQWQGSHRGASIRIAKGVYWRTGGSRGTYRVGEERQTVIDNGTAVITSQRVVFLGAKQTREWAYSRLLGIQHDDEVGATYIQVSNRQKVSGIAYGPSAGGEVQFRLDLALAAFNGTRQEFVNEFESSLQDIKREQPALPQPPPPQD